LTRPISEQNIHAIHDPIVPYGGTDQVCAQADREARSDIQISHWGGEPYINPVTLLHAWECSHEQDGAVIQPQQFIVDAYNRANGLMDPKTGQPLAPKQSIDGDITMKSWVNATNGAETRIISLGTGSHGWAGSTDHSGDVPFHNIGIPNETMDAADAVLKFLVDHPLIEQRASAQSAPDERKI
jgi:poly(3-hydroxybutyrate) depolymerase